MNRMILPESIVYTDTWASCNAFDISDFHHVCINHSKLFADHDNHINGTAGTAIGSIGELAGKITDGVAGAAEKPLKKAQRALAAR